MSDLANQLERRMSAAEGLLRDALRVEIAAFVSRHVEDRLRARPHFRSRMPNLGFQQLRAEIERTVVALAGRAEQPVRDLRAFLGASPRDAATEEQALANALSFVVDATRELLTTWVFPGDDRPDRAGDTGVDLDAEYRIELVPSPNLSWAWRAMRGLDSARDQLADGGGAAAPSLEIQMWLPEALPDDPT